MINDWSESIIRLKKHTKELEDLLNENQKAHALEQLMSIEHETGKLVKFLWNKIQEDAKNGKK